MATSLPAALLDACVLYPPLLRDLFLWLAVEKTYQPKWTEEIHAEWIENLLERRPELSRAALLRTRDLMNPPKTREEYLEGLRINRLNRFAEIVEAEWDRYAEKQD